MPNRWQAITWCDDAPVHRGYWAWMAPGRFQFNSREVIFKLTVVNGGWGISYEIALRWMPLDLTDDESTLVQVMAWCRQATSHYLNQCWPRSPSPYGVTRAQWVKLRFGVMLMHPLFPVRCTQLQLGVNWGVSEHTTYSCVQVIPTAMWRPLIGVLIH